MSRLAAIVAIAAGLLVGAPASAWAHASLEATSPERGAELARAPEEVTLTFSEPVELSFGSLRVFDSDGNEIQSGDPQHPDDRDKVIAVGLPGDLPDGSYTATYRVVSADSHPVSGGFVFAVGEGSPAPAASVSELVDDTDAGAGTKVAFAAARSVSYGAIAFAVGGALFLLAVWRPALGSARRREPAWDVATQRFGHRARKILAWTIAAGIAGTAAGIVLQGAVASGTGALDALDPSVIGDVLDTRFGAVWAIRIGIFAALGLVLAAFARRIPRVPGIAAAGIAVLLAALAATPAFAGHATTQGTTWLLVPSTIVHVLSMSAWVGGLTMLILAVPAATRALPAERRAPLLAETLRRFSSIALVAVVALLATGVIQSLIELDSLSALVDTGFGRLIVLKAALLTVLIGLGAWNRRRSIPAIEGAASAGESPGAAGLALRRVLRTEVALLAAAIVAASFLVAQTPSADTLGPASGSADLGDARLDYTVDPARPGANEIHLYLTDPDTGVPFEVRSAEATASQPSRDIGPIELELEATGPGHFTVPAAALGVAGEWEIGVTALVSRFDQIEGSFEVDVE